MPRHKMVVNKILKFRLCFRSFSFRQEIKSSSIYLVVALFFPVAVVRNVHLRYVPSDFSSLTLLLHVAQLNRAAEGHHFHKSLSY